MNIVCIGSGYVGSVTGAAFAVLGHHTTVLDIDQTKVDLMNAGRSPIYEPGLDHLIENYIGKTLFATTDYSTISQADVVFIGVGTPSKADGTADLRYIRLAAQGIGQHLNPDKFTVIINKSTVPVGTADLVASIIEESSGLAADTHFAMASNPEFLREGYALEDVFFPDRIVIGTENPRSKQVLKELYFNLLNRVQYEEKSRDFQFAFNPKAPLPTYYETDIKSAEMIKYASNAFLAVKISYINEIARLCETLGANVTDVAAGMGMDSRIGSKFLQVSSGWSGSCFPKDTAELLATSQKYSCELTVVQAAVESNQQMHDYVVDKIKRKLKTLNGKHIGILGLTFKPNTDDARKTQASVIIKELIDAGARIKAHDPHGMEMFQQLNAALDVQYMPNALDVTNNVDAVVLLTHWDEYLLIDWSQVKTNMRSPYVLDTRNVLKPAYMQELGFDYEGLGINSFRNQTRFEGISA
ncbi:UDP-glucose dehydrogenase family protein [Paenibacillus roseipurpureus]|uniref:UDP-glucose 6-dehydrogenase n=1 Tax=Paenibacillus roseopurpureus TaxID=2918901 RepID=A0AA96RM22_9BACL|nr:UDP-glucose/GDP-mannose dehydrogenase family protein [Paenibacillus sp. MBLB1832]WNR43762.1 UDP-glucose/GDP-mannose dehydrogenase family protein [Paenibacillus sp. MBLB1832]